MFASLFMRSFCIIIIFPLILDLEFLLFIVTNMSFYYSLLLDVKLKGGLILSEVIAFFIFSKCLSDIAKPSYFL